MGASGGPFDGAKRFTGLLEKAFGTKYRDTDFVQFCLHNQFPMIVSNNSDPFTHLEAEYGYTRQYLDALASVDIPVCVLTKLEAAPKIDFDDYVSLLRRFKRVWVEVTLTTLDDDVARRWEPNAPPPSERLQYMKRLADAGIWVHANCVPYIPGESFQGPHDDPDTYKDYMDACSAAGVKGVFQSCLQLEGRAAQQNKSLREYVEQHADIKSRLDAPWRWFSVDPVYDAQIAGAWHEAARRAGLQSATHQCHGSLLDQRDPPSTLGCVPPWVDLSLSWGKLTGLMRRVQQERDGAPVITTTIDAVNVITEGCWWANQPFSKSSVSLLLPDSIQRAHDRAEWRLLPDMLTPRDLIHLQHKAIVEWGDTAWADRCVQLVDIGGTHHVTECGEVVMSYDRNTPRDSWCACRATRGWIGRDWASLTDARGLLTGKEVYK